VCSSLGKGREDPYNKGSLGPSPGRADLNTTAKNVFLWIVIIVAIVVFWNFLNTMKNGNVEDIKYSEFTQLVDNDKIRSSGSNPVTMTGNQVEGFYVDAGKERKFRVIVPKGAEETVANTLVGKGLSVRDRRG